MFKPFKRKASPRRQAIREDMAEIGIAINPGRARARHMALVVLTFTILAALLQFWPRNPMPYRINERAPIEIRAEVEFPFIDPVKASEARQYARDTTPPVLTVDMTTVAHVESQLNALLADIKASPSLAQLPESVKNRFPSLNAATFDELHDKSRTAFSSAVESFREMESGLRSIPIMMREDYEALQKKRMDAIRAAAATDDEVRLAAFNTVDKWMPAVRMNQIYLSDEQGVDPISRPEIRRLVGQGGEFSQGFAEIVTDCLMQLSRPTYRYDPKLTVQLAERRAMELTPSRTRIAAGTVLVQRGEPINSMIYEKLLQAQAAAEAEIAAKQPWTPWLVRIGLILTTALVTVAGAAYIARMSNLTIRRAWAMAGLFWITLGAAKVVAMYSPISLLAVAPTLLVAIILVIAENPRFGLGMAALHGLLTTLTLRQGIDFYVPLMAGSAIFCFGLGEIRTRGKLIEVGAVAGAGVFAAIWALGLSRLLGLGWSRWIATTDVNIIWVDSLWGAGAGVGIAMFALAILPSIERIFKITTAMTLLELCDANKPLLRRLSQEAAGTFNHSLTVGIMAEAAGNAIGANGLLCRVGAYYHDVGKLSKPQYFIENQAAGRPNRHDKLSPAMSLLIIVGHVKDGIELAREYGLPWVVHQFIAQHHGTTLVEYFYHAARKRAEQDEDGVQISETEFRYPGPRPQTREAAIVMICDGCESVVRAIEEPTAGRIETAVHNMITKRLMDGQFNECDLTLRELSVIEETLVRTLAGIHHGRVAYPAPGKTESAGDTGDVVSQPA